MKLLTVILLLISHLLVHAQPTVVEGQFKRGEVLNYKIKYGWFKIGEAKIGMDKELHEEDSTTYYRVFFNLETVGWLKFFASLDIDFESFINSNSLLTHHAKRVVGTSRKTDTQFDYFRYTKDSIFIKTFRKEKNNYRHKNVRKEIIYLTDALGNYFYYRSKKIENSESTKLYIAGYIYDFGMKYEPKNNRDGGKYYRLSLPIIKELPKNKVSYAIIGKNNIPLEVKLASGDGNFYLVLDE